jgi:DNA-directed RNA polymerase specialized sigma24 family protein
MTFSTAGVPRGFPTTRVSVIEAAAGSDPLVRERALASLIEVYWRPSYTHLRFQWGLAREEAEDLTQEFFARALEGGLFQKFDPSRARFRTFLRGCLDHLAANTRRAEERLKRGGGSTHLSLDFADAEQHLAGLATGEDPDELFHREWVRSLFVVAVDALQAHATAQGHDIRFRIFSRADLESVDGASRPSYRELADQFQLPVTQVTNHLAWARREFRRLVLERLRELSGSEAEYRAEARELFGVDPA